MEPIVTIHSFNDAYAELAAVSITSLVHNHPSRDCHVHIFENSISEEVAAKILAIGQKYPNAKIAVHHISDDAFAEVADECYGKETWYPLLAPEILSDLDKALLLEPDTLVCRDISDLFDMQLGDSPMACHLRKSVTPDHQATGQPTYFNAGVLLFNLRYIRENDAFNMRNLTNFVKAARLRFSLSPWYAQEYYLNCILDHSSLLHYPFKFNFFPFASFLLFNSNDIDFGEICEALSNPAILHYTGTKPNDSLCRASLNTIEKWWEYHALSPFADSSATRFHEIIEYRNTLRGPLCSLANYTQYLFFDDIVEAIEKLKRFSEKGIRVVFYGAGYSGVVFARIARAMGLVPDKVCDRSKFGTTIDGINIESPDVLRLDNGNTIVVIAIMEPQILTEVKNTLLGFGIPEYHILPVFEQLALGGRRWGEILESVHL